MEAFVREPPVQDYVEGVVTYHQYRDALDLTATEAKTHPDTLEAFGGIQEVVTANPEIAMAYIGVIRCRGRNREAAIRKARAIELNVLSALNDLDVVSDQKYYKEKEDLTDDAEVRKRAEQFVRLFRRAIPPDQLPKPRRRRAAQKAKTDSNERKVVETEAAGTSLGIEGLRKGQEPAIEALLGYAQHKGIENMEGRVIAPTGSGKTIVFTNFLEQLRQAGQLPPTVIIEPTKHLKEQTLREMRDKGFGGRIQLHESGRRHDPLADVVIITQQGFARQLASGGSSLDAQRVGLVIFDEAHHIGGERTKEVIGTKLPHAGIVGFTASPDYDARRKLAHHLPDLIHEITNDEAVEWGLISPYQTILLPTHGDLSFAVPSGKDYHQYLLDKATNTSPRNHLVARFLVDNFPDELVIANVNTVNHAEVLAETMRAYGKQTLAVSGSTKNPERILSAFHEREITGLVHARILGEGFDEVRVEVSANVVPTLSEVREKQRVGRGQRIDPDNPKKVLKVVECIDDHYVKKPVLYGTLTGRWLYGAGHEIAPFEPAPGYRVLQDPNEIEAWWNGDVSLPVSVVDNLDERASDYQPVEAKDFQDGGEVVDLARERRKRNKRTFTFDEHLFHEQRRRSKQQEFNDAFNEHEDVDPLDVARRVGFGATSFILEGSYDGEVQLLHMKNALRTLAGHPILATDEGVMERYTMLQKVVAESSQDPSLNVPAINSSYFVEDLLDDKPDWQQDAACLDTPSIDFYPQRGASTKEAKAVCAECVVRDECLENALVRGDKHGIWGGLSERQRRVLRRVRKNGEVTPEEIRVFIARLRGDTAPEPEQEDPLEEFDELFEEEVSA